MDSDDEELDALVQKAVAAAAKAAADAAASRRSIPPIGDPQPPTPADNRGRSYALPNSAGDRSTAGGSRGTSGTHVSGEDADVVPHRGASSSTVQKKDTQQVQASEKENNSNVGIVEPKVHDSEHPEERTAEGEESQDGTGGYVAQEQETAPESVDEDALVAEAVRQAQDSIEQEEASRDGTNMLSGSVVVQNASVLTAPYLGSDEQQDEERDDDGVENGDAMQGDAASQNGESRATDLNRDDDDAAAETASHSSGEELLEAVLAGYGLFGDPLSRDPSTARDGGNLDEDRLETSESAAAALRAQQEQGEENAEEHNESGTSAEDSNKGNTDANGKTSCGAGQQGSSAAPHSSLSLKDEQSILQAIINAVNDTQSSVSGDLVDENNVWNVTAVLDRAEQIAASSSRNQLTSVLHTHEHHTLKDQLKRSRGSAGWPTCIATCSTSSATVGSSSSNAKPSVAVGTTLGIVLLFSAKSAMCGVCGAMDGGAVQEKGSVVSVAISHDGGTVVVGHEKGDVTLWDTASVSVIRAITGEFTTPIIRLRMCGAAAQRVVVLDSEGRVKMLSLSKMFGKNVVRSATLEVSESANFTDMDVMKATEQQQQHQQANETDHDGKVGERKSNLSPAASGSSGRYLVSAVSDDRIVVHVVESGSQLDSRKLCQLHRIPQAASSAVLGQFLLAPEKNVLCVAWAVEVEIFHIAVGDGATVMDDISSVRVIKTSRPLLSLSAVTGWCALLLDQDERVHVLDARAGAIVESQRLLGLEAAYFSSKHSGITYHGSTASDGESAVLVLGKGRVVSCNLLSWTERLDALVKLKKYTDALELAKGFAHEVALGIVGLSSDPRIRRREVHKYIVGILTASMLDNIESTSPKKENFVRVVDAAVAYCADIDAMDIFFGPVMDFLRSREKADVGLYCLGKQAQRGKISVLPDIKIRSVFQLFSNYSLVAALEAQENGSTVADAKRPNSDGQSKELAKEGETPSPAPAEDDNSLVRRTESLRRAENILLRLREGDSTLLEIAEAHDLLRLKVGVMSCHWHKYIDALYTSLDSVDGVKRDPTARPGLFEERTEVAIQYVEATLKGRSIIPETDLPMKKRAYAKRCLLDEFIRSPATLERVLRLDPQRILTTFEGLLNDNGMFTPWDASHAKADCIALLVTKIVGADQDARPWELERRVWPPYACVNQLLGIVANLVITGTLQLPDLRSFVERVAFHVVFAFQKSDNPEKRRAVQKPLCALLDMPSVFPLQFPSVREELKSKRVSRALAILQCNLQEFVGAIDTYLDKNNNLLDPGLSGEVFRLLTDTMNRFNRYGDRDSAALLREAVKRRISELVNENATALAQFVFEFLPDDHQDVMNVLRSSSRTFLRYLEELIAKGDSSVENDVNIQNSYISLLCELEPAAVYPYLHSRDTFISYDLQVALKMVRRYRIADATIFLLEKTMMIDEAMSILVGTIADSMQKVRTAVIENVEAKIPQDADVQDDGDESSAAGTVRFGEGIVECISPAKTDAGKSAWADSVTGASITTIHGAISNDAWATQSEALKQAVDVGVDLCGKYHNRTAKSAGNWFSLLDLFTRPRRLLCDRQEQDGDMLRTTVSSERVPVVDGYTELNEIDFVLRSGESSKGSTAPGSSGGFGKGTLATLSAPLTRRGATFLSAMIGVYTKYVAYILTHMVKQLDLSLVVGKIVEDHERERFGPFKPIIVDILDSLNFDVEVNRLCKACTDDDTLQLAAELHRGLSNSVVPKNAMCSLCGLHLCEVTAATGLVRFYSCGHGSHEECCLSAPGLRECWQCRRERIGERAAAKEYALFSMRIEEQQRRYLQHGSAAAVPNDRGGRDPDNTKMFKASPRGNDSVTVIRKLRHTRTKLDGTRNYMDLLRTFKTLDESGAMGNSADKVGAIGGATQNLILAPVPKEPISIGELGGGTPIDLGDVVTENLTEDEIMEMFGITDFTLDEPDMERSPIRSE